MATVEEMTVAATRWDSEPNSQTRGSFSLKLAPVKVTRVEPVSGPVRGEMESIDTGCE